MDLVLAAVSPDAIVYLIVFVLWGLAQLTRLSKKKGGTPTTADETPRPVPPELRDLLETLTGRRIDVDVKPPVPARTMRNVSRAPVAASPQVRAAQRQGQPIIPESPPGGVKPEAYALPQADSARGHFAAASQFVRQAVTATPVMRLPVMNLAPSTAGQNHPSHLLSGLYRHDELRAAIAQRAVLGPPRAFDPP